MADELTRLCGFGRGSFAKPGAALDTLFGVSMEEAVEYGVRRAKDGGCTCKLAVHVGAMGVEFLHEKGCPRLRTIGNRN